MLYSSDNACFGLVMGTDADDRVDNYARDRDEQMSPVKDSMDDRDRRDTRQSRSRSRSRSRDRGHVRMQ